MKLLIAVPTLDFLHFEFVESLTNLIMYLKNERVNFEVKYISGTLVYVARDRLACHAINNDFTHVLWLDSDMVFPTSIVDDLMDLDKPIVSGIYHARRKPFNSCIFKEIVPVVRFDKYPSEPFKIGGCGFGIVLTSVEVLKAVKMNHDTCFLPMAAFGEDLAFCCRARDLGYEIWCDPTVRAGHIAHYAVYEEDHERWKKEISNYDEVKGW